MNFTWRVIWMGVIPAISLTRKEFPEKEEGKILRFKFRKSVLTRGMINEKYLEHKKLLETA